MTGGFSRWLDRNVVVALSLSLVAFLQGKIVAQGRLILQDTFMVSDQDGGLLSRMKERRVFLFEQIVIFSEPLDKKKGFSTPGYLFKNSIKVRTAAEGILLCCVDVIVV